VSFTTAAAPQFALFFVLLAGCAGGEGGRDIVPPYSDRVVDAGAPGPSDQAYEYVARRPLAVVALAESRGIAPAIAIAAVDRLADAMDACATDRARRGPLGDGAARVVGQIDPDGAVAGAAVRVDPGAGAAQAAVLCLVAPFKLLIFPQVDAGVRGLAIEAIWGRVPPVSGAR